LQEMTVGATVATLPQQFDWLFNKVGN
jgi:hypothetical protein